VGWHSTYILGCCKPGHGGPPDDATTALRHARHRLGAAEDGLDRAITGLHRIGHLPADWRAEFEAT
jgi:hypothetical protein